MRLFLALQLTPVVPTIFNQIFTIVALLVARIGGRDGPLVAEGLPPERGVS
jgi:hypothetical protein